MLLSACSETASENIESDNPSAAGLAVPTEIINSRAIDLDQVFPQVTLSDGRVIDMTPNNDGTRYTGSIEIAANTQVSIEITWFENFGTTPLTLASLTQTYSIGNTAFSPTVGASEYNKNFDDDNDGFNNLTERNAETNPRDRDSRPNGNGQEPRIDVEIARISPADAPVIDGLGVAYTATAPVLTGEWAAATQNGTAAGDSLYIDNLMIDNGNTQVNSNPFHRWSAMHDGTFLYILIVVDDLSVYQSDSEEAYQDDSIDIFIDGDNSDFTNYGDADDRFFGIPLLELNTTIPNRSDSANARLQSGFGSAPLPEGIEFATGLATGPLSFESPPERHDVYEIKLPLAGFGITPGSPFGLEFQVNDDDDGGERDAAWGWVHPTRVNENIDQSWQDPSILGTAILTN